MNRRKREQGFTLLEALIGVLLLSVGILGFMAIQYQSINGRLFSKRMNEAVLSGSSAVEERLTEDFTQMNGSGTAYRKDGGFEATEQDYLDGKAHEISWDIKGWSSLTTNPNAELGKMKTLSVVTNWLEKEETRITQVATWARGGKVGDSPEN